MRQEWDISLEFIGLTVLSSKARNLGLGPETFASPSSLRAWKGLHTPCVSGASFLNSLQDGPSPLMEASHLDPI